MKFKNTTSNSIILINEQTAFNLKSVTETATVYSIEFQVDLNEAAKRNNAFGGKIYFSKVAKQTPQPIFSKDRKNISDFFIISFSDNLTSVFSSRQNESYSIFIIFLPKFISNFLAKLLWSYIKFIMLKTTLKII